MRYTLIPATILLFLILVAIVLFLILKPRKTLGIRGKRIKLNPYRYTIVDQREEADERKKDESSLNGCLSALLVFIVIAVAILGLGIFLGLILPFVGLEWFLS